MPCEGRLYAATGNLGKVFRIGLGSKLGFHRERRFSPISTPGGVFRGDTGGGAVRFETRSGNLDRQRSGWSPWAAVQLDGTGGRVVSPNARFLQWRLTLGASAAGRSPFVDAVWVAYLSRNAPPVMEAVEHTR
jgi:hypothetical protein